MFIFIRNCSDLIYNARHNLCRDEPELAFKVASSIKARDMQLWNATAKGVSCMCYNPTTICNNVPAQKLQDKMVDNEYFLQAVDLRLDADPVSTQVQMTSAETTVTLTTFQNTPGPTSVAQLVSSTELFKIMYPVIVYVNII